MSDRMLDECHVLQAQRHSVAGPWQRRSVVAPPAPQSVAVSQRHPPPGASQRNVGNPRFGPLCPSTVFFLRRVRFDGLTLPMHALAIEFKLQEGWNPSRWSTADLGATRT